MARRHGGEGGGLAPYTRTYARTLSHKNADSLLPVLPSHQDLCQHGAVHRCLLHAECHCFAHCRPEDSAGAHKSTCFFNICTQSSARRTATTAEKNIAQRNEPEMASWAVTTRAVQQM